MKHKFFDEDVDCEISDKFDEDDELYVVAFNCKIETFNIHKKDVIFLAKKFGLDVYDANSKY